MIEAFFNFIIDRGYLAVGGFILGVWLTYEFFWLSSRSQISLLKQQLDAAEKKQIRSDELCESRIADTERRFTDHINVIQATNEGREKLLVSMISAIVVKNVPTNPEAAEQAI